MSKDEVIAAVVQEMRHRAEEGCTGSHDGVCCDPEMGIHPEDWCNRCLMGAAVVALSSSPAPPEEAKKEQEKADTRVDEGQPQACRPAGSTATTDGGDSMRSHKPPTERTWMNVGATREQAKMLLSIPEVPMTDEQIADALRDRRATNMWGCAVLWMSRGYRVVTDTDGSLFYRTESPQAADAVDPVAASQHEPTTRESSSSPSWPRTPGRRGGSRRRSWTCSTRAEHGTRGVDGDTREIGRGGTNTSLDSVRLACHPCCSPASRVRTGRVPSS